MTTRSDAPKIKLYLFLLAIQITGVVAFVHQELPEFRQVVVHPGAQLPPDTRADLMAVWSSW